MDAEYWTALQAVHGAVHTAHIGVKYTWFGSGYISNVYFKVIANHPTYYYNKGGDLAFLSCTSATGDANETLVKPVAFGDSDGNPVAQTGW